MNKGDIIRVRKNVKLEFTESGVCLQQGEMKINKSAQILSVIEVFNKWISIENGLKELTAKSQTKKNFFTLSTDFYDLLKKDFFEFKNSDNTTFNFHNGKFDAFPVHIRMLNDTARTLAFQQAIRETVTPNDIVLDIGTGNGILAATAAIAGAKHVYAIERTEFIEVAGAVFKANGLENKITLIKGDSTTITLPEKATVLVSEIIGNDPFAEGIIRTFKDAKERLLTPDAKIIPKNITVFAMALEVDSKKHHQNQLTPQNIINWEKWYGIDFSPFLQFNDSENLPKIHINSRDLKNWKMLTAPVELAHLDFTMSELKIEDCEKIFSLEKPGTFNGLLLFFESTLADNITLSLHPDKVDPSNHWSSQLYFISSQKGENFKVEYSLKDLKSQVKITKC